MRNTSIFFICLFAMLAAGVGVKAQEVTITLNPGTTWIGYYQTEPMDITTALGNFVPVNGDKIKSLNNGTATYMNGQWRGSLSQFTPGLGYMYTSMRNEPVSISFAGNSSIIVTTGEPTDITTTTVVVGVAVTVADGGHVFLRGVCWGTEPNPDIEGNHTFEVMGAGSFNSVLENLTSNTTYHVRAYAVSDEGLAYGEDQSFTTEIENHEYVDLGLPSGTLWATCNIGANAPEEYGDYFAWGETQPKSTYVWSTYQYCNGSYNTLTKYCSKSSYGYNGFTDNLTTLLPEDDAATANWGNVWRMPTKEEFEELYNNTNVTWTTQNGVSGRLFTASNGNSLFLPAAGLRSGSSLNYAGSYGGYWSSSLSMSYPNSACCFTFGSGNYQTEYHSRDYGHSVRAVRSGQNVQSYTISVSASPIDGGNVSGGGIHGQGQNCTVTATANSGYVFTNWTENGEVVSTDATYTFTVVGNRNLVANFEIPTIVDHAYVDLGLPSGLLWATCNVGADNPEDYGDYFAWGETAPKDYYDWSTYQYCNGSSTTITKYCSNSYYSSNDFTDDLTTLLPEDDAATANWGSGWRMPTKEEWQELYQNTTHTWTTQNGVNGRLFTASNGNSLFLPAAGSRSGSSLNYTGSYGYYWSSSLYEEYPHDAWNYYFYSAYCDMYFDGSRCYGQSVRAVLSGQSAPTTPPTGAINGNFSINSNGDQVYFSQGNLQYIGSATTPYWKFAEHQWDVLGTTTGQNSSDENVDRDLFGWGTNGYNHGAVCYQPWNISTDCSDYYAYGNELCNLYSQTAQADWGYNPISNGGNQPNQWRTLTREEWVYVFETRETNSGIRYAKALVNEVNGVILLPDNWNTSYYTLNETNNSSASFSSNVITSSQWSNLELHGAVFLPAASLRYSYGVDDVGSNGYYNGYYCSSSRLGTSSEYIVSIKDSSLNPQDEGSRCFGFSVRLVSLTIENGTGSQNNAPTGAIDGKFSINAYGIQVYFSQGNLQYIGSVTTPYWKFAEHQWDYLGKTTGQNSDDENVDRDLFGWGTSGNNHGAVCYQPWSVNCNIGDYYAYGNHWYNLNSQTGQADWGYNPISNGGNQPNQWRTLTIDEWAYIFNTRETNSGIRYARAIVNEVNGVILLPDNWNTSYYTLNDTNNSSAGFSSNVITASQWSNLELHGAVFLPAAGYRTGIAVSDFGSSGSYWSASCDFNSGAYSVGLIGPNQNSYYGYYGFSVRLVHSVQ